MNSKFSIENLQQLSEELKNDIIKNKLYLNNKLSIKELAERIGITEVTISEIFNKQLKKTFYEYINSLRVKHSETLLKKDILKQITLDEISRQSGFASKSTFYKAFKEIHHMTPKQFSLLNIETK